MLPPSLCSVLIYYYNFQWQQYCSYSTTTSVCVCVCVCPDPPYLYLIQSREQRAFILVNKQRRESRWAAACCCWHELRASAQGRRDRRREDRGREDGFPNKAWRGLFPLCDTNTHTNTGQSQATSWCETAGVMMPSSHMGQNWQSHTVVQRNDLQTEKRSQFFTLFLIIFFTLGIWDLWIPYLFIIFSDTPNQTFHFKFQLQTTKQFTNTTVGLGAVQMFSITVPTYLSFCPLLIS